MKLGIHSAAFVKDWAENIIPYIKECHSRGYEVIEVSLLGQTKTGAQKIAKLIPNNIKLIDLSADFRLNNSKLYKKWYGIDHHCKKLIKKSIYAITEFSKHKLDKYFDK